MNKKIILPILLSVLLLCNNSAMGSATTILRNGNPNITAYANMHVHENATATTINTVNIPHFIQGLFSDGLSKGFTFSAGSTGAITAFADAGGGQVTVTSAAHGLLNGDAVTISGTTNYNGIFIVANKTDNTYEITDTWVVDDATGNWYLGDRYTVNGGSGGVYQVVFHAFGASAAANKNFEFEIYVNGVNGGVAEGGRRFSSLDIGTVSGGGLISLSPGDVVSFAIINQTDTTDFTFTHISLFLHKI